MPWTATVMGCCSGAWGGPRDPREQRGCEAFSGRRSPEPTSVPGTWLRNPRDARGASAEPRRPPLAGALKDARTARGPPDPAISSPNPLTPSRYPSPPALPGPPDPLEPPLVGVRDARPPQTLQISPILPLPLLTPVLPSCCATSNPAGGAAAPPHRRGRAVATPISAHARRAAVRAGVPSAAAAIAGHGAGPGSVPRRQGRRPRHGAGHAAQALQGPRTGGCAGASGRRLAEVYVGAGGVGGNLRAGGPPRACHPLVTRGHVSPSWCLSSPPRQPGDRSAGDGTRPTPPPSPLLGDGGSPRGPCLPLSLPPVDLEPAPTLIPEPPR